MNSQKTVLIFLVLIIAGAALVFLFTSSFTSQMVPNTLPSQPEGMTANPAPGPAISGTELARNPSEIRFVKIAGQSVAVDLALTMSEQTQGLSGRRSLSPGTGMLFVFGAPAKYGFWMKEMEFPIDIIWLSQDLKVVYIEENAQPSSYPETFSPPENAKYVLEVNAGFSKTNGLKIGDSAEFFK